MPVPPIGCAPRMRSIYSVDFASARERGGKPPPVHGGIEGGQYSFASYTAFGSRCDKSFNPEPTARLPAKSNNAVGPPLFAAVPGSGLNNSIPVARGILLHGFKPAFLTTGSGIRENSWLP